MKNNTPAPAGESPENKLVKIINALDKIGFQVIGIESDLVPMIIKMVERCGEGGKS
jgi:hypothetical protein